MKDHTCDAMGFLCSICSAQRRQEELKKARQLCKQSEPTDYVYGTVVDCSYEGTRTGERRR